MEWPNTGCVFHIQMDRAESDEDIDLLLDILENMAVINASGWPPTKLIGMTNKSSLLQGLIFDELITKRQSQITAIRKGLASLGILRLCRTYPHLMKELFVYSFRPFGAAELMALIAPPDTTTEQSRQAWEWFKQYVQARECEPAGELC